MYLKIAIVSIFLFFLQHAVRVIYLFGYHVTVYNHTPGPCHAVSGVDQGAEDMETLPNGLTFITSGFWWSISSSHYTKLYQNSNRKGKVLLFDFQNPEKGITELTLDSSFDQSTFHPHGISVIQDEHTGKITLFIVNHLPTVDRIEKFEFEEDSLTLKHVHSYEDEALVLANDVAATSDNTFYFTNYAHSRTFLPFILEVLLYLPWGNVVYYDGANYQVVSDGLLVPNGIFVSQDRRYVYVANGFFTSMSIFEREKDNHLLIVEEYQLYSLPDNFLIEPKTGNILIGAHPVVYQSLAYLHSPDLNRAPSKVLMIHMSNSSHPTGITELYSDDGNNLSGSSVASIYDNKMLIGTVLDKLMFCELRVL